VSFDEALRKKVTTPVFAFSFLRSSLMTSVSTRYTPSLSAILHANEVVVFPDPRDCTQCFREMPLARTMQGARQDLAMLGFGTAAMCRRAVLQRLHQRCVDTTYDQVRHVFLVMIQLLSMIAYSFSEISMANSRRLWWEYFEQRALRAQAMRDEGRTKEEVAQRHPELAGAMATIRVAELFVARHLSAEADRIRFMKLVRDAMGRAIEHETRVPAPKLREPRTRTPDREVQRANARTRHGGVSDRDAPAMERG
jgi:hypothetical protein